MAFCKRNADCYIEEMRGVEVEIEVEEWMKTIKKKEE